MLTPIKAIRAKCLDCCCGSTAEVRRCPAEKCALHPYRMGKRPKAGEDTREHQVGEIVPVSPHYLAAEAQKESPLA